MESPSEPPPKVNKHLRRFFLGWQNPLARELILFLVFGFTVTFLVLGFVILSANNDGFTYAFDYTDFCANTSVCALPPFTVPANVPSPLFLRYRIDDFYINHYKFWRSVPLNELVNNKTDRDSVDGCDVYTTNAQMNKTVSVTGRPLNPNDTAIPCGVTAFTYFNDAFTLNVAGSPTPVPIATTGIAWTSDRLYKFVNVDLNRQWIDVQDERFINWMRVSPYNHFAKTWGVVNTNLSGQTVLVTIANNWNASRTRSRKQFVLTSAGFYGTPNTTLVTFFLVFAFLGLILGLLLCYQYISAGKDRFFGAPEPSGPASQTSIPSSATSETSGQ